MAGQFGSLLGICGPEIPSSPSRDVKLKNGKRRRSRRGDGSAFRGSLWFPGRPSEDMQPARDARINGERVHINPAAEGGYESWPRLRLGIQFLILQEGSETNASVGRFAFSEIAAVAGCYLFPGNSKFNSISGGQDGFQDEQTTKDRQGPSSVVSLPHEYPCQTGMAARSQKSSPIAAPPQIPHTPYPPRTRAPLTSASSDTYHRAHQIVQAFFTLVESFLFVQREDAQKAPISSPEQALEGAAHFAQFGEIDRSRAHG